VTRSTLPVLLAVCACAPAESDGSTRPATAELVDLDPAPDRVRVVLVAAEGEVELLPGTRAAVWGYRDGSNPDAIVGIPGPLLRAPQGARVEIELRNELQVETTIHWHGVRLPADQDGTTAAQIAVAPGETFTYAFIAADAGTFWYHPHVEADVQIERGLYGAFVVDAPDAPEVAADRVLVLDDVKLRADGSLDEDTNALDLMLGRQGNVLLVDGRRRPTLVATPGSRERWRFVNAANGRYFALRLPGATLRVIGSDGGLLPVPRETDTVLVAPGERYDVLVDLPTTAGLLALQTVHYDRGHDIPDPGPQTIAELDVRGEAEPTPDLPTTWPAFAPLLVAADTPTRELVLSEDDTNAEDPKFFIDGAAFPAGDPVMVDRDALEVWTITNEAEMDHPFHIHGLFFQVLDGAGIPRPEIGWKDTVNVPRDSSVRLAVRFDNPGDWMMHCHILEHAERGMMGMLHVRE